jgi:hypothetical protein
MPVAWHDEREERGEKRIKTVRIGAQERETNELAALGQK